MDKSDVAFIVVLLAVIGIVAAVGFGSFEDGYKKGIAEGRREVRQIAVTKGYGAYGISHEGKIEFHWTEGESK